MADSPRIRNSLIAELRSLPGRAKPSFPQEDRSYGQVERLVRCSARNWELPYDTPDQEYPDLLLVQQQVVGEGDDHFVEVYRRYKKLAGVALKSYSLEPGGLLMQSSEQPVAYGTLPDGQTSASGEVSATVLSDRVVAGSAQEAVRLIQEMVTANGSAASFPEVDVEEWQEKPSVLRVTTRKIVPAGTAAPQPKTAFRTATGRVWTSSVSPIPDSHREMLTVVWSERPVSWVDYPKTGFPFPAIFKYSPLVPGTAWDNRFPPPWPGDGIKPGTYKLIGQRQTLTKARAVYTYHDGASGANFKEYSVTSPGATSKYFSVIPNNCIHQAFKWTAFTNGGDAIQVVEDIPASVPSTYNPRDILIAHSEEREWHGGFYEHVLIQVSEATSAYKFPAVYDTRPFVATEMDTITQPASKQRLQLLSSDAADTMAVIVYGWRNNTYTKERVTLTGTTPVSTTKEFTLVTHVRLLANAVGTVTVRGIGTGAGGQIQFDAINDGDYIDVGRFGSTKHYVFQTVLTSPDDVQRGATVAKGVANLIHAINGTGTPGTDYAATITIHPDVQAALAEEAGLEEGETAAGDTVLFSDKIATDYQRSTSWVLSGSFSGTASTFISGDNGATVAAISSGKHAYRAISFNNPELLEGNPDAAAYNLPAFLNAATDELVIASPGSVRLRLCASGDSGIACAYQRRANDTAPWSTPTALPNLKNGTVHTVDLPGTTTRIRLHFYNGGSNQSRKVHADVGYAVSV